MTYHYCSPGKTWSARGARAYQKYPVGMTSDGDPGRMMTGCSEMDDGSYHIKSIEEAELPIDPINAYNLFAIYLRAA